MTIKEAKEQIRDTVRAYCRKNAYGEYEIPLERQRPVFLMGPPGIGKTAVMAQVAQELGIAFVSYSMTHHTRQSALGLPIIKKKTYDGTEYDVSEYTMSEIIASVYERMEQTGKREGILFLAEINCVSETLTPLMLQFLQYKVFGRHRVPDGWVVVTAGNPPEYNASVREFDFVTWDRLKRIDVEPDLAAWKEYAYDIGVHPAVLSYLDAKPGDFYRIEATVDGTAFVTARGWTDLSEMIRLYEQMGSEVNERLVCQYLQDPRTAKDFAVYYDLFRKYRSEYQIDSILAGTAGKDVRDRAKAARFDERLALLSLLIEEVSGEHRELFAREREQERLLELLREIRVELQAAGTLPSAVLEEMLRSYREELERDRKVERMAPEERDLLHRMIAVLEEQRALLEEKAVSGSKEALMLLKKDLDRRSAQTRAAAEAAGARLDALFSFCEDVFGAGQEILILVTELTANRCSARFIAEHGCEAYFRHNKELLFFERHRLMDERLSSLDLPPKA
jgi:hypothetical protein